MSKKVETVYRCPGCNRVYTAEDEIPAQWECSNDGCGATFLSPERINCEECNRPFTRKVADRVCEDCETELEEMVEFPCGNECEAGGYHETAILAEACKG